MKRRIKATEFKVLKEEENLDEEIEMKMKRGEWINKKGHFMRG